MIFYAPSASHTCTPFPSPPTHASFICLSVHDQSSPFFGPVRPPPCGHVPYTSQVASCGTKKALRRTTQLAPLFRSSVEPSELHHLTLHASGVNALRLPCDDRPTRARRTPRCSSLWRDLARRRLPAWAAATPGGGGADRAHHIQLAVDRGARGTPSRFHGTPDAGQ